MREIDAIIAAYDQAKEEGTPCALATVVHVEGSSYRRAGARMLVDEYGRMTGAISGGCLEGDALRKALHALHQGRNKLVTYDTSDEADAVIGAQLGCNGVIQVLFEPLEPSDVHHPVELLRRATRQEQNTALVSLFHLKNRRAQIGTVLAWDAPWQRQGHPEAAEAWLPQLEQEVQAALAQGQSHFCHFERAGQACYGFIEVLTPSPNLVLVGAGNDARVLAQMAEPLGWNLFVVDGRPTHAAEERFSSACQVIVARPEALLETVPRNERSAFVLLTHNYHYDLAVLRRLLPETQVPYIGVLGPRKKHERMLQDLAAEGIHPTDEQLARVYAPVGLSLDAETPAEIALSVLAEIQAVFAQARVEHLRDRSGPIHPHQNYQFKAVREG